jgi:hypothetical protein
MKMMLIGILLVVSAVAMTIYVVCDFEKTLKKIQERED